MLFSAIVLAASSSYATTQLSTIGDSIVLSDGSGEQTPDLNSATKTKLVRLSNGGGTHGRLITVFGDAWGDEAFPEGHSIYDVKAQSERAARDIYARYSDDDGVTWSNTINLSNTAAFTSSTTQWQGEDVAVSPYYGDSDKPNIFNAGNSVVVSWVDKYCDAAAQGTVTYVERDMREIPYSCTYAVRSINGGTSWMPAERLSDGSRDAKQDVNKGSSSAWVVTWQEDPDGLALGEADGPGDGASGANVSKGTDIWYSQVSTSFDEGETIANSDFGSAVAFSAPSRITNNWTKMEDKRNTGNEIESGKEGASRANLALIGGTVVVAYEETKGSEGIDEGKYIRYQSFPFKQPPGSLANACMTEINGGTATDCGSADLPPNPLLPESTGCILSRPEENGRRVRFLTQGTAGSSGTKLFIFWKQGEYSQGGPSDIVSRYATDFVDLSTFSPALNSPTSGELDGCLIAGDPDAETTALMGAQANVAAMNLSHNTPTGGDLTAITDENPIEDARAHRGYIRGDTIVLGYSYTPDGVVARATDLEHYNFWIRRSLDGGATWEAGVDMTSALMENYLLEHPEYTSITQIDVKEPRIVKTPGNGPATCPSGDPEDATTTNASECSNLKGFVVAGGLVENTYEHLGSGKELDLFITRSVDAGETYEVPIVLAGTSAEEFESQIRMTPSLDKVFAVWNSSDETAGKNGHYIAMEVVDIPEPEPEPAPLPVSTGGGGGGGSTTPGMLILMGFVGLLLYRKKIS